MSEAMGKNIDQVERASNHGYVYILYSNDANLSFLLFCLKLLKILKYVVFDID